MAYKRVAYDGPDLSRPGPRRDRVGAADQWEPPPGMVRRQCRSCGAFYAGPPAPAPQLCAQCARPRKDRW